MKLSWPTGIILAFITFIIFIFTSIYMATNKKIELVREDYYEQELKYQNIIDRKNNYFALGKSIEIAQENENIKITFPTEVKSASIHFYKVNSASQDVIFPYDEVQDSKVSISTKDMHRGIYTLKILWDSNDEKYYFEKTIRL